MTMVLAWAWWLAKFLLSSMEVQSRSSLRGGTLVASLGSLWRCSWWQNLRKKVKSQALNWKFHRKISQANVNRLESISVERWIVYYSSSTRKRRSNQIKTLKCVRNKPSQKKICSRLTRIFVFIIATTEKVNNWFSKAAQKKIIRMFRLGMTIFTL